MYDKIFFLGLKPKIFKKGPTWPKTKKDFFSKKTLSFQPCRYFPQGSRLSIWAYAKHRRLVAKYIACLSKTRMGADNLGMQIETWQQSERESNQESFDCAANTRSGW